MKKSYFLKIENIKTNYEGKLPFISQSEKGEFEIYDNFIKQKKNNKKGLSLKAYLSNINKELGFTNFGFSTDGNIMAFIYNKQYLVVFDKLLNSIKYLINLPEKIFNNIEDYISEDKRGFLKKIFSRIGFNEIIDKTNNLFISESGNKVLIASSKNIFFNF